MSVTRRLFFLWVHRTLQLTCGIGMIVFLALGYGSMSLLMFVPLIVNAGFAEMHRRLLERER